MNTPANFLKQIKLIRQNLTPIEKLSIKYIGINTTANDCVLKVFKYQIIRFDNSITAQKHTSYTHYKNPDKPYIVMDHALINEKKYIIYESTIDSINKDDTITWIRELYDWNHKFSLYNPK
jgi:hypothetical protein